MVWLVAWCLLTLGFVFLAREAEATEWVRKAIRARAEWARAEAKTLAECVNPPPRTRMPIFRFLDAMLDCAPCVSAWASMPAAALVYGLYLLADNPWVVAMLVVACPVGAVGLLYALTVLSPVQAVSILGRTLLKGKADAAKGKDPTG